MRREAAGGGFIGADAESDYGHQWPEGITAGVIAAGAAAIRGRGRPDRWDPPVGVREGEGGRALVLGCGCGRSWAADGPWGKRERGFPGWADSVGLALWPFYYYFLSAFLFLFLFFFKIGFKTLQNILPKFDKIGFDKNRSNAHLGIVL